MICSKCGAKLENESMICLECGTKNFNTTEIFIDESLDLENIIDKMTRAYMGEFEAETFLKGGFSWCAFMFGWMYYFYRKLYKKGLIAILASIVFLLLFIFVNYFVGIAFGLVVSFILSSNFKKWYVEEANEKVKVIYENNKNLSIDELLNLATKAGGVSKKNLILCISCFILLYVLGYQLFMSAYNVYNSETIQMSRETLEGFTNVNNITYTDNGYQVLAVSYSYSDSTDNCSITYYNINGFTLHDYNSIYDAGIGYYNSFIWTINGNNISLREVNGINFYDYEAGNEYYAFTTGNYYATVLKFTIQKNDGEKCSTYRDNILNNVHYIGQ